MGQGSLPLGEICQCEVRLDSGSVIDTYILV